MTRRLIYFVAFAFVSLAAAVLSLPWFLYWIGLSNLTRWPIKSSLPISSISERTEVLAYLRDKSSFQSLSPWSVTACLIFADTCREAPSGEKVAWFIARNNNAEGLQNRKFLMWHVSGASLTIWLTRNWTEEEMLAKARDLLSAHKLLDSQARRRAE